MEALRTIAADLSDLSAVLRWCRQYETDCETIARTGQAYARTVVEQLSVSLNVLCWPQLISLMNTVEHYSNQGGELLSSDPRMGQRLIAQAIKHAPNEGICWFNLGIALHQQQKIKKCIRAYQIALEAPEPPYKSIYRNLAQDLLLSGHFKEGWELYEKRFRPRQNEFFINLLGSPWQGPEKEGWPSHLVLAAEQGFGDTLQFCRYALLLQAQGIRITLFCQPQLVELLRSHTDLKDVVSEVNLEQLEEGSRWCPLMSLPHRLKTEKNSIPHPQLLTASAKRVEHWQKILRQKPGTTLIGLHWQEPQA